MKGEGMSSDNESAMDIVIRGQAETWLLHLKSGQATVADAAAFRRWRDSGPAHAAAFVRAQQVWQGLAPASVLAAQPEQFEQPRLQLDAAPPGRRGGAGRGHAGDMAPMRSRRLSRRGFLGAAVTAGAAYVAVTSPLGLWPSLGEMGADYRTVAGEQKHFTLDGVMVELNTRSAVKHHHDRANGAAIEVLGGEVAIATTAPGAAGITVLAAGTRLDVRQATELNLRCEDGWTRVSCVRGQVDLHVNAAMQRLAAGEQAIVEAGSIGAVERFDSEATAAWRKQLLVFDGQPLSTVVGEINRYWSGRIVLTDAALGARVVHLRMSLRQLDSFPSLVRNAYGANVRRMPGGIVLLG